MKVLQVCAAYKPAYIYGGPTMSVSMLAENLVKNGIYTEVYATTANGKTELPVKPNYPQNVEGVTVTYFKRLTKDHTHFSPALIGALWKNSRHFDMIHIHAWWNTVSLFSCLVGLLRGVPVLISPRGTLSPYSFGNRNNIVKWLIHATLGKPMLRKSYIHATSKQEADSMKAMAVSKNIAVLPNFVKFPTADTPSKKDNKTFRLIFLSRIEQKKGLEILIRSLPMLTFPFTLTIAGDGSEGYINTLKQIVDHDSNRHIQWAGFQGDSKFGLLARHDLLILPSYDENFGNVVIESLSQGTAVLLSPYVGLCDYVKRNNFGWESQLTPAAFANEINYIYSHQEQLDKIRIDAPVKIKSDFDEARLTNSYVTLYEQILHLKVAN